MATVRETQLFNLAENPHEYISQHEKEASLTDLAENPDYKEKLQEMEALLLSEMRRLDDPYRLWNQPDDGLTPPPENVRKKRNKKKVK